MNKYDLKKQLSRIKKGGKYYFAISNKKQTIKTLTNKLNKAIKNMK